MHLSQPWTAFVALTALLHLHINVKASPSADFKDPPNEYRPKFRYWFPDASVPISVVQNDIANLSAVGAGGLEFLPFYLYGLTSGSPPTDWSIYGYGTPAYAKAFKGALQSAKDNNLVFDFAVGASQGQGAPAAPGSRGLAVQLLAGNVSIAGGEAFNGPVPPPKEIPATLASGLGFQHALEQFGTPNLTAVIAFEIDQGMLLMLPAYVVNEESVVDLTESVVGGNLSFMPPNNNATWRIFSFWEAYTNQRSCAGGVNATNTVSNGSWVVDHFSSTGAQVTTDFLDHQILSYPGVEELLKDVGNYAWEDSMEMMATLWWTPGFLGRFERSRGYRLTKYLPLLYVAGNQWGQLFPSYLETYIYGNYTSDGISVHNLDYRTVLNEGYQEYIEHFKQWAHSNDIKYSDQPAYNLPLQMLSDIPLLDAPETESLGFGDLVDSYRQFSGPAHLHGNNVVSSELGAVLTPSYSQTVPDLLYHIKRSWAGGITQIVIHGGAYTGNYPNTTWPGYQAFGFRYTENWSGLQPCWQHLSDTLDYVGRTQYVLQQGIPKIDLAFYLYESPYTPATQFQSDALQKLGYTYDYLGPDNLLDSKAVVKNQVLAADGPGYKALIFSNQTVISTAAAAQVLKFAEAGFPIFFIGAPPNQTLGASAQAQAHTQILIEQILAKTGNVHRLDSARDLANALSSIGIAPRAQLSCSSNPVYTVWRSDPAAKKEYLFIYNDQSVATTCTANLTVATSKTPYILDAWTGTQEPLLSYQRASNNTIYMDLDLKANETRIISFTQDRSYNNSIVRKSVNVKWMRSVDSTHIALVLAGPANVTSSTGKVSSFNPALPSATSLRTWDLTIQDWHGPSSPEDFYSVRTEITTSHLSNISLVPWSSLGHQYASTSGVGIYTTTFATPESNSSSSLGAFLSFPPVQHTLRASLNGHKLPPVDPTNPVVNIGPYLAKADGKRVNTLEVKITTTLFNKVKAEANTHMFVGSPISEAQPLYATTPNQEYGLLGPVEVEWTTIVEMVL
ncbi:uncharacterized protein Z518_01789 [Rhinocladiella mackenziei CBS 650.93]|uniref:Secreted protein n=1 Tax=Rhinocladiella mackenziei CBS 650.93 TaxID=1442369 RepID=A0A0D2JMJ8_9EURO|nr:uncharacterized protein Z518_01789 [Rhinocladiella mackenziei CBS 650.93]KIX10705.1 hypothetical protein Z518_01789 [Rhinocladiella mackenziei CBS 650.93]